MGTNHVRILGSHPRCVVTQVIDTDLPAARELAGTCGAEGRSTIRSPAGVDAAIIASSTGSHFDLAREFLASGIPTLVEKPVTTSIEQTRQLIDISQAKGCPLMCGFVERFNPVVATSKELIEADIFHIRTQRQSPPPGRYSSNAIWDLLIHDLDLVLGYFQSSNYESLSALGYRDQETSSVESAEAAFEVTGAIASTMCSRLWQRKVRTIQIATNAEVLELDLVQQTLTIYRNLAQEQFVAGTMTYRSATTIDVPYVRHGGEPLALQLQHFIDLVTGKADPVLERQSIIAPHALAGAIDALCG